jgi:hypothetical protein
MIKLGTGKSREMCSYISKDFFREYLKAGKFDRLKDRTLRKTGEPNGRIFGYFSNHYKDFFISKIGDIFKLLFLEILDFDIEDGSFSIRNVCERKAVLDGFSHNKVFQVNYFFLKESTFYFVNEKILFGIRIPLDLATELVKMKDELKAEGFAVEAETFETGFITFGNIDTFIDLIPKNKRLEAEATISRIKERKERERKEREAKANENKKPSSKKECPSKKESKPKVVSRKELVLLKDTIENPSNLRDVLEKQVFKSNHLPNDDKLEVLFFLLLLGKITVKNNEVYFDPKVLSLTSKDGLISFEVEGKNFLTSKIEILNMINGIKTITEEYRNAIN